MEDPAVSPAPAMTAVPCLTRPHFERILAIERKSHAIDLAHRIESLSRFVDVARARRVPA
jgi:hypothetical protein